MKKIFFVLPELRLGGSELHFINLANYLISKKNIKIYFFFKKSNIIFLNMLHKDINKIKVNNYNFINLFLLINYVHKIKPSHIFSTLSSSYLTVLIKLIFGKRIFLILRLATQLSSQYQNLQINNFYYKFKFKLFCLSLKYCDILISQSHSMKSDAINFININKSKIHVFNNPVNLANFYNKNSPTIENSKIFRILFIGRLEKVKNPFLIILFFLKIRKKINKLKLIILGEGKYLNDLQIIAKESNYYDDIKFINTTIHPHKFIKESDMIVSCSTYEGYSNTIIESILARKLVMVSNALGGNKEIFGKFYKNFSFDLSNSQDKTISNMLKKFNEIYNNKINYSAKIEELANLLESIHDSKIIYNKYLHLLNENQ